MKRWLWLRIVHSGDWCLRLALRPPSGACHTRRREKKNIHCTDDFSLTHFNVRWSTRLSNNTDIGNWKPQSQQQHLHNINNGERDLPVKLSVSSLLKSREITSCIYQLQKVCQVCWLIGINFNSISAKLWQLSLFVWLSIIGFTTCVTATMHVSLAISIHEKVKPAFNLFSNIQWNTLDFKNAWHSKTLYVSLLQGKIEK